MIFFFGCQRDVTVPQDLIGVWETSVPTYADRHLAFTENELIYGIGNGEEISHYIQKIDVEQKNNEIFYIFHYLDSEKKKWTQALTYNPYNRTIQLNNRKEKWEKSKR